MANIKRQKEHSYHATADSEYIRTLTNRFSSENCGNYKETEKYATNFTHGRCLYCGKQLYEEKDGKIGHLREKVQWDHLFPASIGGLFAKGNVALSCPECNNEKNNMSVREYYEIRLKRHDNVYFKNIVELNKKMADFTMPYYRDWPQFAGMALTIQNVHDAITTKKLIETLEQGIHLSEFVNVVPDKLHNLMMMPDAELWLNLRNENYSVYRDYSIDTIKGYTSQVTTLANEFVNTFGKDTKINELSTDTIVTWLNKIGGKKAQASEYIFRKYAPFARILLHVLHRDDSNLITNYKFSKKYNGRNIKVDKFSISGLRDTSSDFYVNLNKSTIYTVTSLIKYIERMYLEKYGQLDSTVSIHELNQNEELIPIINQYYEESSKNTRYSRKHAIKLFIKITKIDSKNINCLQ